MDHISEDFKEVHALPLEILPYISEQTLNPEHKEKSNNMVAKVIKLCFLVTTLLLMT